PFDADAAAGPSGFGRSSVTHEEQLGVESQIPQRHRRLQTTNSNRPKSDLRAFRADERRHAIDGVASYPINGDRGATRVVTVESRARVHVQLGAVPRPKDRGEL